jgi:hypothetical protein
MHIVERKELPHGYLVTSASFSHYKHAVDFVVCHPSFDIVPDGVITPDWDDCTMLEIRVYDLKTRLEEKIEE